MISDSIVESIVNAVKKEPLTVNDIATLIGKSWVTADNYLQKIKDKTGLINIKTFRKGSHGALKVVYYNHIDSSITDELKQEFLEKIKQARDKKDFDMMDIFQYVKDEDKKSSIENYTKKSTPTKQELSHLFKDAKQTIFCFSGNLSFLNIVENNKSIIQDLEECLQRKVLIKIITRINLATLKNLDKISHLIQKYPNQIEIRHAYQPLRGFVIDNHISQFKDEETINNSKAGELDKNVRITYNIYDKEWINWFEKVFWSIFRTSIDHNIRLKELKKIF